MCLSFFCASVNLACVCRVFMYFRIRLSCFFGFRDVPAVFPLLGVCLGACESGDVHVTVSRFVCCVLRVSECLCACACVICCCVLLVFLCAGRLVLDVGNAFLRPLYILWHPTLLYLCI